MVIPSFNRPGATAHAVRSALGQTLRPHQIVVVDDASDVPLTHAVLGTDETRVELIRLSANGGAAAARQAGVDAANGDVVAFLDSDDLWTPGKLEAQRPLLLEAKADPRVAVASGWDHVFAGGRQGAPRIPRETSRPADFASGCWFCPGSTTVVSRRAFDLVGPFDGSLRRLEDYDWFLRFGLLGGTLRVQPAILATVAKGQRGTSPHVREAERVILAKLRTTGAEPEILRRARAYMALERARAALNEGRRLDFVGFMARSLWMLPRLSIQLQRWWR